MTVLLSLNDKIQDKFFKKAFVIALYFYYMELDSGIDSGRSVLAKGFLSISTVREAMMDVLAHNDIVDRKTAMEWLNRYFDKREQFEIANYIMTNKLEKALEMPSLYNYVFSQFDRSFAADHLLKYFADPKGRSRTQGGWDKIDYGL